MSEPIMFINTMRIATGQLEGYKQSIQRVVQFVEANGPQLMVEVYVDEAVGLAYSVQLYRDSASIQAHWQMSDPYISDVMEHAIVERLDIYGLPNQAVMERIRRFSDQGVDVSVVPNLTGFSRLSPPAGRA